MKRLIRLVKQLRGRSRYAEQTDDTPSARNTQTLQNALAEARAKLKYAENERDVLFDHFEVCPIRIEPIIPVVPEEGAYVNTKTNQLMTADTVAKMNVEPLVLDTQQNTFYSHEALSTWLTYIQQHPINRTPYRKEDWVYISNIGTELSRLYTTLQTREQTICRQDETIEMYSEQARRAKTEILRLYDTNQKLRKENNTFVHTVNELTQRLKQKEHTIKNNSYINCSSSTS
jgi:hydroxymethylpyrimidine pyrophosphatase-like HAD family hydrolase